MKKIAIIITFISIAYGANNKPYITKLTLNLPKKEINKDSTIEAKVLATYSNNTTKELTKNIEWVVSKKDALKIKDTKLTAIKDYPKPISIEAKVKNSLNKIITSNKESLKIYWEVDGHRLPPEPDPKVNNATLLGIDSNSNGVRDDVERWIYEQYKEYKAVRASKKPIYIKQGNLTIETYGIVDKKPTPYPPAVRAAVMDVYRALQQTMVDPSKARETTKAVEKADNCLRYIQSKLRKGKDYFVPDLSIVKQEEKLLFNTSKRARAYGMYNYNLSGGVFRSKLLNLDEDCSPEVKSLLGGLE